MRKTSDPDFPSAPSTHESDVPGHLRQHVDDAAHLMFDTIIRGAQVVTPWGIDTMDVAIANGRIAALGHIPALRSDMKSDMQSEMQSTRARPFEVNAHGKHLLPGIIDTHVHFREPGLTHKEDMLSGSRAALLGGVTSIFEMPNTQPATTRLEHLEEKLRLAQGRMHTDHAFYMGATRENLSDLIQAVGRVGCAGVKVFVGSSTGDLLLDDEEAIDQLLMHLPPACNISFHAEWEARLKARKPLAIDHARQHPHWRDEWAAFGASWDLACRAAHFKRPIHILHISSEQEVLALAAFKPWVSLEVTPQHLLLAAPDCYDSCGNFAQMNPPIRAATHAEALWKAVLDGTIDTMGSDHAPHTVAEKSLPYPQSPSGLPGVEMMLALMLTQVHRGKLSLMRAIDLLAHRPAQRLGILGKGRIARGMDADLVLVDMQTFDDANNHVHSQCGWSPYAKLNQNLCGWAEKVWLRGQLCVSDGSIVSAPSGQPLRLISHSLTS